jgi:hypothetical protein
MQSRSVLMQEEDTADTPMSHAPVGQLPHGHT